MNITQIYEITNSITKEILGETAVVNEDLSNIVEIGKAFENAQGLDNYVRALNDKIGKMVFVDRVYKGRAPSVLMDGWEFGSIVEKVSADLPQAYENESWELENNVSYDPNIFYKPSITVSCWNNRVTFEIPISFTERQVKSAFTTPQQMNSFISMIYTAVSNAMTIKLDALIQRTINNFIGMTVSDEYAGASISSKTGVKAVNLLYRYNDEINTGADLTADEALTNPDFIKYATFIISQYTDRLSTASTLFNIGGKVRFTPDDKMKIIMLSQFAKAADIYLQSSTFHDEFTALPTADIIPYWQGSGVDYDFSSTGKVAVKTSQNDTVEVTGVLAVIYDRDALGVVNENPRVTTNYNAKGEFWNEYHKYDAGYFNDINENFVVFFVA